MQPIPVPAKSWRRVLALLLALGALVVLLIATALTSQAFVTTLKHDTLDDFAEGEFHKTGLLDIPPDIDSVQLIPIGLFGEWDPGRALPVALTELSAVADGGHIVVIGGHDGTTWRDEVYISTIDADGSLGEWREQTAHPLPQAASGATAVVYPKDENSSWIYVLGGFSGSGAHEEVYRTTLAHSSGTIGAWTATEPLTVPVYYLQAVALDGYVYAVGGHNPIFPWFGATNGVFYSQIQGDGSLGAWQEAEFLPEDLDSHLVVAYSGEVTDTLYVIGGRKQLDSTFHVYFADVNPDGSLTPWTLSEGNLPAKVYAHSGALFHDQIFVTGGKDENNTEIDVVKAALIDPENPSFRLYDWCLGIPPPTCTIGAWETGPLLPPGNPRAFHITVGEGRYIYTLGGYDGDGNATDTVFWGAADEPGALYSPWGHYISPEFDLETGSDVRKLEWGVTMGFPLSMTADLTYRYKPQGGVWGDWSGPIASQNGTNTLDFTPPLTDVRLFQYRIDMTTDVSSSSPLLDWVEVYYDVPDPEVEVRKDTGEVVSVTIGQELQYTIYYTNNGGWVAEGVILTETLPDDTTYAGGPEWQQVGASNQYTHAVGDILRGAQGSVTFRVMVNEPQGFVERITNTVEIDYPPMTDALGQIITDPAPGNNEYEFSNPLNPYRIAIDKAAEPPAGTPLSPGDRITYTITYTNIGQVTAEPAIVTDTFTPYTNVTVITANPPANIGDHAWNLGPLAPDEGGSIQLVVQITDTAFPGDWELANFASLDSPQGLVEDSPVVIHTVEVPYEVGISKDAAPPPGSTVAPKDRITYTIHYENTGLALASQAVVTDTFDFSDSYTILSYDPLPDPGTDNVWSLGTLDPGGSGDIQIVVQVKEGLPDGLPVTNRASLGSANGPVSHSSIVTHTVKLVYEVEISKDAAPPPGSTVAPKDRITYTIHYENTGTAPASQAVLTDTFDPNDSYTIESSDPPPDAGTDNIWSLGPLNPGDSGDIQIVVQLKGGLPDKHVVSNQASLGSADGPVSHSLVVTHMVGITSPYEVEVTKDAVPPPDSTVTLKDRLTYTIHYENIGTVPASQAVLTDTFDPGDAYTILSSAPSPDAGTDNIWSLGTLDPGDSGDIQIVVQLKDILPNNHPVTNFASLGSADGPVSHSSMVTHIVVHDEPLADLVAKDLRYVPASPRAGQPVDFYVTIANEGALDANEWFGVELYIKPSPSNPPDGPSDHDQGYCLDSCAITRTQYFQWGKLSQGDSTELYFQGSGLRCPAAGAYDIYVQVDVAFDTSDYNPVWGRYPEQDETNNIKHKTLYCGPPRIYLPVIVKNAH